MHWKILYIGKPKLPYARAGAAEYLGRLEKAVRLEVEGLKEGRQAEESERLLKRSEGCFRVALDPGGRELETGQWVEQVNRWEMRAVSSVAFLIGGADGHSEELRNKCDLVWSLSRLTLQHELALVVLLEQIYRVYSIKRGEPYHRE